MDIPETKVKFEPEETFEEKKIEDEFAEREDLLDLNEKTEEIQEGGGVSKMTEVTQPSGLSEPVESFGDEGTLSKEDEDSPLKQAVSEL